MRHIETPDKKHLLGLINDIRDGKFVIPDFQREFEWNPWDVVDLLKSIFMDYYIGTLLFWRSDRKNIEVLKCEKIYGFKGKMKPDHIVLDGQQRLTALYFSFFEPTVNYPQRKSKCHFFLDINKFYDTNQDDAFYYEWENKTLIELLENENKQFEKLILPLSIVSKGGFKINQWLEHLKTYWNQKLLNENNETDLNTIKENIQQFSIFIEDLLHTYYISFIELDRDIEVSKVCDIFTKINSKGIPLSIFDLLNAILRPHELFLKELWRDTQKQLIYIDPQKMKIYILMVMSIMIQKYCSPKYLYYLVPKARKLIKDKDGNKKNVILINNDKEFISLWDEAVVSIKKAILRLKNPREYGAIEGKYLPYPSIIPVFSSILQHINSKKYDDMQDVNEKIWKWYWASIFMQNYSSAVESQSTKDYIELIQWFADHRSTLDIIEQFKTNIQDLDFKSEVRKGTAKYNAILNLCINNGAKDFRTYSYPEYNKLDDHHIVPHSWGIDKVGDKINTILNRTLISNETNRIVIHDRLPNEYIKEMFDNAKDKNKVSKMLESHFINEKSVQLLLKKNFDVSDYYAFIEERQNSIKSFIQSKILNL